MCHTAPAFGRLPRGRGWMYLDMQKITKKVLGIALVATIGLTWLDLATKDWALEALSVERQHNKPPLCERASDGYIHIQRLRTAPIVLIDGYLEFRYAENCGAAFGMLHDAPEWVRSTLFTAAALVATGVLGFLLVSGRGGPLFVWSVPLVVSGALGNLIDRFRYGYVVDFIRFHLQNGWEWPTFNVADITISIGVGLMLLDSFLQPKPVRHTDASPEPEQPPHSAA